MKIFKRSSTRSQIKKESEVKEGNIIFLAKKRLTLFNPLSWVSNIIALFQGKATHTALVFKKGSIFYIREMGAKGTVFQTYKEYINENKGRIIAIKGIGYYLSENTSEFNDMCANKEYRYDFTNLAFRQPIRILFGIKTKRETEERRICSEDTARCINTLKHIFEDVENLSPQSILDQLNEGNF